MRTESRQLTVAVAGVLALVLASDCSKPKARPEPGAGGFDRQKLLAAIGECASTTYADFRGAAAKLELATTTLAASLDDPSTLAARTAWQDASDAWQLAETMQIGPLAPSSQPGGRSLRDEIYSWPLLARCVVDQNLVAKAYEQPGFATTALTNTRGLLAAEYLLFHDGPENGCPSTDPINVGGTWSAISSTELRARRAAYAKVLAADVSRRAQLLVDAWDPAKENFLGAYVSAGAGSAVYPSQASALEAASDALFYLDLDVKDTKLATPLGLVVGGVCDAPPCLELLESRWSKRSKQNLRNDLLGFRRLFEGCSGPAALGFDDLLVASGASSLEARMKGEIAAALAALDSLPGATLEEALAKDPASGKRVYDAVKAICDDLKTEFVSILLLQIPDRAQGDND